MSESKYSLRKLEFPQCARETLIEIDQLICGRSTPTPKQYSLAVDLAAEFIFYELDRRNSRKSVGLTSFQELQLLDVLIDYFSGPLDDNSKSKVFLLLFDRSSISKRINILCKLTSLAIAASKPQVLKLIGTSSQILDCSIVLAKSIIQDHFILQSTNEPMKALPDIAPTFTTDIMTAIVQIYLKDGTREIFLPPPLSLLETITNWVYSNPKICLCSHLEQPPPSSNPVSPLGGLAQWCILAPLHISKEAEVDLTDPEHSQAKRIKKEKDEMNVDISESNMKQKYGSKEEMLYAKLHLGVLQSLHEAKATKSPPSINAQQIIDLITQLNKKFADIAKHKRSASDNEHIQISLDRLAQFIQICLACRSLHGNISGIFSLIDSLPESRMLKIIVNHYKK